MNSFINETKWCATKHNTSQPHYKCRPAICGHYGWLIILSMNIILFSSYNRTMMITFMNGYFTTLWYIIFETVMYERISYYIFCNCTQENRVHSLLNSTIGWWAVHHFYKPIQSLFIGSAIRWLVLLIDELNEINYLFVGFDWNLNFWRKEKKT